MPTELPEMTAIPNALVVVSNSNLFQPTNCLRRFANVCQLSERPYRKEPEAVEQNWVCGDRGGGVVVVVVVVH
jgi:hypothetical protein